ncbi:MAG: cryptochrome/photolyase family protein [Magnetovibrionaceae bacterium]
MKLALVLVDQVSLNLAGLRALDPSADRVLLVEARDQFDDVPHHRKKIVFLLSAYRHFAERLRNEGFEVVHLRLDDEATPDALGQGVSKVVDELTPEVLFLTEPGSHALRSAMEDWREELPCEVQILEDGRFLCSHDRFAAWAEGRKQLRMEYFYREMRKDYDILLDDDGKPIGGEWNYDSDNRKKLPKRLSVPDRFFGEPDNLTKTVIKMIEETWPDRFGDLQEPYFVATPEAAEDRLDFFIQHLLPNFGDYQDAMKQGEPWLFHSVLSPYINNGLLDPLDVCRRAEQAYHEGQAPLNAVEGFIRQIIGWREYVRGIYWRFMPDYADRNALGASRDLPGFYWTGETELNCLAQVIAETKQNAYAHHIQRLMITGQFAMLIGVEPEQICDWYLAVYADAFDWVERPNTQGMATFADGGLMASKPYCSSGAYIERMSDYCGDCRYDVKQKTGEDACPFNYLYWDFLDRNRDVLKGNPRLGMPYRNLEKMSAERVDEIQRDSKRFLKFCTPSNSSREN